MFKHLALRTKFILVVNVLVVLLVASAAFVVEMRQRNAIIEEVRKRALVLARSLADASANSLVTYNYVGVEQSLAVVARSLDVVYAVVLDKEGNVAASSVRSAPIQRILTVPDAAGSTANNDPIIKQRQIPGSRAETVYDVWVPVVIEGSNQRWGAVRLGVSLESMYQEINRTRLQIAAFGLLALVVGIVSSTVLARRITKPLQALTNGVAAVGRGDFAQRIEVTSQDELGQLSVAFNEMTQQLGRVRDLEERLRRADRLAALGTMAAGIAHDIRNPLTSILIFSQLMSLHHDDPDVREKFDRVVPRELERVQAVIEDMMELARPATLHLEPVNLNEVLTQVLELYEGQATTQGIKITREFDPALPPCTADRKRVHRCFSNLIANAIQAMPNGGDLTTRTSQAEAVLLAAQPGGTPMEPAICVTISDTGQGIPPERLSRIFDPFYTTKDKGLGLGMAITHRIVEDHKGTIDVQSQVGLGTTFIVHLPLGA